MNGTYKGKKKNWQTGVSRRMKEKMKRKAGFLFLERWMTRLDASRDDAEISAASCAILFPFFVPFLFTFLGLTRGFI